MTNRKLGTKPGVVLKEEYLQLRYDYNVTLHQNKDYCRRLKKMQESIERLVDENNMLRKQLGLKLKTPRYGVEK